MSESGHEKHTVRPLWGDGGGATPLWSLASYGSDVRRYLCGPYDGRVGMDRFGTRKRSIVEFQVKGSLGTDVVRVDLVPGPRSRP